MTTLDSYTRRVVIALSVAAIFVIAWKLSDVFILLFGGLILATVLRAMADRAVISGCAILVLGLILNPCRVMPAHHLFQEVLAVSAKPISSLRGAWVRTYR